MTVKEMISVVSWGEDRLDVFGIGTDSQMHHNYWDQSWQPPEADWKSLGGTFTSSPAVATWGKNRLDVFGVDTDSQMHHRHWDGSKWQPEQGWESLGGTFT